MDKTTEELLGIVSDWSGKFQGAYNIRENGACAGRQSSENIQIESKTDAPGLIIHIKPGTIGETVYIPACVTHGDIDDLVYNDFYVGEGSDVTIIAGCGVHTDDGHDAPPQRNTQVHSRERLPCSIQGKTYRYRQRCRTEKNRSGNRRDPRRKLISGNGYYTASRS